MKINGEIIGRKFGIGGLFRKEAAELERYRYCGNCRRKIEEIGGGRDAIFHPEAKCPERTMAAEGKEILETSQLRDKDQQTGRDNELQKRGGCCSCGGVRRASK